MRSTDGAAKGEKSRLVVNQLSIELTAPAFRGICFPRPRFKQLSGQQSSQLIRKVLNRSRNLLGLFGLTQWPRGIHIPVFHEFLSSSALGVEYVNVLIIEGQSVATSPSCYFDCQTREFVQRLVEFGDLHSKGRVALASTVSVQIIFRCHSTTRGPFSCLLYTSPSPRDQRGSRMPSSA